MSTVASPVCFARASRAALVAVIVVDARGLPQDAALALANALPFLRCGEESAVHAFGRRLARGGVAAEQTVLDAISADEARHAAWLEGLAMALPPPDAMPDATAMASFFRRLLTRDRALHFARVAALDLAVCALLRPLAARGGALAAAPAVATGLRSIRSDEARHVRVARRCASRLGFGEVQQRELDLALRRDLRGLLAPVQSSLTRLGIHGFGPPATGHDA